MRMRLKKEVEKMKKNEGDEEALSEVEMEGNKEKGRERIEDRNMFEIYG